MIDTTNLRWFVVPMHAHACNVVGIQEYSGGFNGGMILVIVCTYTFLHRKRPTLFPWFFSKGVDKT